MFIAALFTITKIRKQPRCPSAHEWVKKLCNLYTVEYSAAIKKEKKERKRNLTFGDSMDGPGDYYAK